MTRGQEGVQTSEDLSLSLRETRVRTTTTNPSAPRGGTEPVPLRWMERKKGTGKGQEGEREEGAKGGRPGGDGKELGVSK